MPNLQDFVSKFTARALRPLNPMNLSGFVKGAFPGFKKRFNNDDEFGSHSFIVPKEYEEHDLLNSPHNSSSMVGDQDFESVSPLRAAQSAYPAFQEKAQAWATEPLSFKKALQDMGDRQTENPLGYMMDAALGGFGGAPAVGGAMMAGDMSGARLGTVGGAMAKGFDEAKKAGRLFQGVEGAQKFEIADNLAQMAVPTKDWIGMENGQRTVPNFGAAFDKVAKGAESVKLRDILKHDLAYENYPERIPDTAIGLLPKDSTSMGVYDPVRKMIGIREDLDPADAKSTLLHEFQHLIQDEEGFAPGGTLDDHLTLKFNQLSTEASDLIDTYRGSEMPQNVKDRLTEINKLQNEIWHSNHDGTRASAQAEGYHRLAGEVESRNVQGRMNMTPAERQATPFLNTMDMPADKQIIRRKSKAMSLEDVARQMDRMRS